MHRFLAFYLFGCGFLTHSSRAGQTIAKQAPDKQALAPIWKVSDADSSVYLAGSVHLLRPQDLPINPVYDQTYELCTEVVFEIDMAEMLAPGTNQRILKLGTLPEGETLADKIGDDAATQLSAYLTRKRLPPTLLDRYTPGLAFLTIENIEATSQGAQPDLGLETHFFERTKRDQKPSRGLETIEFQISLFDQLDPATLLEMLQTTLAESKKDGEGKSTLDLLISAWRAGEMEVLNDIIRSEMDDDAPERKALLTDRNRNWIPAIEAALADNTTTFFLVGTAHLIGTDSVVSLLEEKKLQISRLTFVKNE